MLVLLSILSIGLIAAAAITLVHNDYWVFKIFEYPRLQKLLVMVGCIAGWLLLLEEMEYHHYVILFLLIGFSIYYVAHIFPYTSFWPKEIKRCPPTSKKAGLKVFAANVLQDNRDYHRMLQQIKRTDPDIVFLLETDEGWAEAMQVLEEAYSYTLLEPLDNTYGLLFYSRLKMRHGRVVYRVKNTIPSIEAVVELPNGQPVQLWGLHPEPPVPGENMYATAKDKELMKVALLARKCKLPSVVFGDLNDVAWSHTTKLFRKTSGLLDPRIGRGFYSTFSAHHWWIRFPLDYIFCSSDFGLMNMRRLPPNGSDHFATFVHLIYEPSLEEQQSAPLATAEDISEAKELAQQPLQEESK